MSRHGCCDRDETVLGIQSPTDESSRRPGSRIRLSRPRRTVATAVCWVSLSLLLFTAQFSNGFSVTPPLWQSTFNRITTETSRIIPQQFIQTKKHDSITGVTTALFLIPPPGSGYARPDDTPYKSELPDTYEPMMAFPGTMRPGMTPENMPYQDLPIADDDPDPVPWPHFQQIEWHHRWSEPPHKHPGTMESFIEAQGRWATPEMEASMRSGARRDFRERQEQAAAGKQEMVITDDDEDDDDIDSGYGGKGDPVALGDGIFGKLGSDADRAATAAAVAPDAKTVTKEVTTDDDGLDDFLLDLGLDAELGDDNLETDDDDDGADEVVNVGSEVTAAINVDDDEDELSSLGLDDDDDDIDGDLSTVPLEDFSDSDSLDTEDIFDEGGFDFDDGDFGGDDVW